MSQERPQSTGIPENAGNEAGIHNTNSLGSRRLEVINIAIAHTEGLIDQNAITIFPMTVRFGEAALDETIEVYTKVQIQRSRFVSELNDISLPRLRELKENEERNLFEIYSVWSQQRDSMHLPASNPKIDEKPQEPEASPFFPETEQPGGLTVKNFQELEHSANKVAEQPKIPRFISPRDARIFGILNILPPNFLSKQLVDNLFSQELEAREVSPDEAAKYVRDNILPRILKNNQPLRHNNARTQS